MLNRYASNYVNEIAFMELLLHSNLAFLMEAGCLILSSNCTQNVHKFMQLSISGIHNSQKKGTHIFTVENEI